MRNEYKTVIPQIFKKKKKFTIQDRKDKTVNSHKIPRINFRSSVTSHSDLHSLSTLSPSLSLLSVRLFKCRRVRARALPEKPPPGKERAVTMTRPAARSGGIARSFSSSRTLLARTPIPASTSTMTLVYNAFPSLSFVWSLFIFVCV